MLSGFYLSAILTMLPSGIAADRVGLLRVRGKAMDVLTMLALGLALSVVALVVPPPS